MLPQEFLASDPWYYSRIAYQLQDKYSFESSSIFDHRLGVVLPVALSYKLFGVSIISTNIWPFLSSLIIIFVVFFALSDSRSKIIGLLLIFTSAPLWEYSSALYPDLIVSAFMALSILFLFNRDRINPYIAGILGTTSLFLAFLTKGSALWILPLWAFAFYQDLRAEELFGKRIHFYISTFLIGLILGTAYLLFCWYIWDSPFSRLNAIESFSGEHLWSWDQVSSIELFKRLTVQPAILFVQAYGALFILMPVAIFFCPPQLRYWSYYTCLCVALFWFGSASLSSFQPMPLYERMTLPVLPALAILVASVIPKIPFSRLINRPDALFAMGLAVAILVLPLLKHIVDVIRSPQAEAKAISVLKAELESMGDAPTLVLTSDSRSPDSLKFFFSFNYPDNLTVSPARQTEHIDEIYGDRIIIYKNHDLSRFLEDAYDIRNSDDEIDALPVDPLFERADVKLYRVDRKTAQELIGRIRIKASMGR